MKLARYTYGTDTSPKIGDEYKEVLYHRRFPIIASSKVVNVYEVDKTRAYLFRFY